MSLMITCFLCLCISNYLFWSSSSNVITLYIISTYFESLTEKRGMLLGLYEKIAKASQLNGELLAQSMGVTQHLFQRLSSVDRRVKNSNYQRFGSKVTGSSYSSSISTKG